MKAGDFEPRGPGGEALELVATPEDVSPRPASVYAALGLKPPRDSDAIRIVAPDVAENGASVPVEIQTDLPQVERILLIGERNLFPLLADASFNPRLQPWFEARIKLAETSKLHVLVQANGQLYSNSRTVRVILGGCLPG